VATLAVTGRADLTDAQWAVLEPLLPRGKKPGRHRRLQQCSHAHYRPGSRRHARDDSYFIGISGD
jgi:transposase